MKTARTVVVVAVAAIIGTFLTVRAANADIRYEDCETSDQINHEPDCGFWTYGNQYRLGAQPGPDWRWVWWSWVNVGAYSVHEDGWKPPHGLKPPRESGGAQVRRKQHEKGRQVNPVVPITANPRQQGGNQGFKNKDRATTKTTAKRGSRR